MKSFCDLPLLKSDPITGMLMEEGIPESVDMAGYEGPRGMAEALIYSEEVTNICELSEIANSLGYSNVRILRVADETGTNYFMTPSEYECLDRIGIYVFVISSFYEKNVDILKQQFIGLIANHESGAISRWSEFVTYRSAMFHAGLNHANPEWLTPNSDYSLVYGENKLWDLGVSATVEQMAKFSDMVLIYCDKWNLTKAYILLADTWLKKNKNNYRTIDELISMYSNYIIKIGKLRSN